MSSTNTLGDLLGSWFLVLGSWFLVLGGWALFTPELVEGLAIQPEHQIKSALSKLLIMGLGALAILHGVILNFSRQGAIGLLFIGLCASVSAFGLLYHFFFQVGLFTNWIWSAGAGNFLILVVSLAAAEREAS